MKRNQKVYSFTFLRHGESVGNADGYYQGQSDFPLNQKGIRQIHALVDRWKEEKADFDLIISSPLSRARQTAELIAASFQVPLELDDVWMERDNGYLAGLTHEEGRRKYPQPDFSNIYQSFAVTGEGDWELFLRAGRGLHSLLRKEPGNYLVVSHGGLLNLVMYSILGISPQVNYSGARFRFENTGFARFLYFPGEHRWQVETINDHHHWKDAG
ncbi:histidine phosphatase family protein [Chloroflexota bacterium]